MSLTDCLLYLIFIVIYVTGANPFGVIVFNSPLIVRLLLSFNDLSLLFNWLVYICTHIHNNLCMLRVLSSVCSMGYRYFYEVYNLLILLLKLWVNQKFLNLILFYPIFNSCKNLQWIIFLLLFYYRRNKHFLLAFFFFIFTVILHWEYIWEYSQSLKMLHPLFWNEMTLFLSDVGDIWLYI